MAIELDDGSLLMESAVVRPILGRWFRESACSVRSHVPVGMRQQWKNSTSWRRRGYFVSRLQGAVLCGHIQNDDSVAGVGGPGVARRWLM